jgi:hypothetical protein
MSIELNAKLPSDDWQRGKAKTILIIALLAVITGTLAIFEQTIRSTRHARAFLQDASSLRLRVTTSDEVGQLALRFGGRTESSTCGWDGCSYFFSFDNRWLRRLRLAPYVTFTCTLGIADGVLKYRRMILSSGNTSASSGAFIEERLSPIGGITQPFYIARQWEGSGKRWRVHVELTPEATVEEHKMAYALNLTCLSRIGGCKDAQQLLPSLSWEVGTASSGADVTKRTAAGRVEAKDRVAAGSGQRE